jgi:hypothetical protein
MAGRVPCREGVTNAAGTNASAPSQNERTRSSTSLAELGHLALQPLPDRQTSSEGNRFRKWPPSGHHQSIAGNYAIVRTRTREVVGLGLVENLAEVRRDAGEFPNGVVIYTRLNVSRAQREAEHLDLGAADPGSQSAAA